MARKIVEGGVYYPKKLNASRRFRRVISIVNDRVFYSSGGDKNHCCALYVFKKATQDTPITETENA